MIQASERGNVEVVRYLLEARAGVDMVDARTHYWVAVKELKLRDYPYNGESNGKENGK